MILKETYTLSNGVKIPKLGLGTWFIGNDKAADAVKNAVSVGYRHIDTAQAYGNEEGVGKGILQCGVPRSEIFVTSKVSAEHKSYDETARSIDETIKKMGLDYLDMMIIHSPQPWSEFRSEKRYFNENKNVWRALEDAYRASKLKAIGVSNFLIDDLENLLSDCGIKPMVNQVLAHIGSIPRSLMEYCGNHDILIEAYSPIAHGTALKNGKIAEIADKYKVTAAQLCIKYTLELGMVSLPKTSNPDHMRLNSELDFEISNDDMRELAAIDLKNDYGEFKKFPVFSGK